jgi:hypothetical protein
MAMPRRRRLIGVVDGHRLAIPLDTPRIGLQDAVDDLYQGALAGAVLAEQCVNLAARDVEVDSIVGDAAGERLGDAGQGEQGFALDSIAGRTLGSGHFRACHAAVYRFGGIMPCLFGYRVAGSTTNAIAGYPPAGFDRPAEK